MDGNTGPHPALSSHFWLHGSKKTVRDNSGHTSVNRLCCGLNEVRGWCILNHRWADRAPSVFWQAVGLGERPPINVHSRSRKCRSTWCPRAALRTSFSLSLHTVKGSLAHYNATADLTLYRKHLSLSIADVKLDRAVCPAHYS